MRGDHPQQRDPFVEYFRCSSQDFAAGNQDVKSGTASAFEKVVGALE
jgi:hypothetical protein